MLCSVSVFLSTCCRNASAANTSTWNTQYSIFLKITLLLLPDSSRCLFLCLFPRLINQEGNMQITIRLCSEWTQWISCERNRKHSHYILGPSRLCWWSQREPSERTQSLSLTHSRDWLSLFVTVHLSHSHSFLTHSNLMISWKCSFILLWTVFVFSSITLYQMGPDIISYTPI